jgi:hypothetical protein
MFLVHVLWHSEMHTWQTVPTEQSSYLHQRVVPVWNTDTLQGTPHKTILNLWLLFILSYEIDRQNYLYFTFISVIKHTCVTIPGIVLRRIPLSHLSISSNKLSTRLTTFLPHDMSKTDTTAAIKNIPSRIINSHYRRRMLSDVCSLRCLHHSWLPDEPFQ